MSDPITSADAKAYLARWSEVERVETALARAESVESRFRQLNALFEARHLFPDDPRREQENDALRGRWQQLREMLGGLQFELDAIAAAVPHAIGATTVRLPRVEDLMILKAIAHRPRDMLDLEALLDLHPDADISRVRGFLVEFARAASMPSIIESWDRLLARRRPGVHEPD